MLVTPTRGEPAYTHPRFPLIGGDPALDFANTVGFHASDHPWEWLRGYEALVAWGWQAGLLAEGEAQRLLEEAARRPAAAARALEDAKVVRETVFRLFAALSDARPPAPADLAALNAALAQAFAHLTLAPGAPDGGGSPVAWTWAAGPGDLDRPLWPVVRAAANLLTDERVGLVRQCAGEGCGWLFLDTSRKRNRRWCRMADCGNRAKARRHRARHKSASQREENPQESPESA